MFLQGFQSFWKVLGSIFEKIFGLFLMGFWDAPRVFPSV